MSEVRAGSSEVRVIATDELRRMLDERGVEYKDRDMFGKHVFHWGEPLHGAMFTDGCEWTELVVENATPEQAIDATLGRGTCRFVWSLADNGWADHTCSACGYVENTDVHVSLGWHYCPNCGREVVDA